MLFRSNVFMNRTSAPTGNALNVTGITTTSFTPSTALPAGDYRLWLRAVDGSGTLSSWSTEVNFKIAAADLLTTPAADPLITIPTQLLPRPLQLLNSNDEQPLPARNSSPHRTPDSIVTADPVPAADNPLPAQSKIAPAVSQPAYLQLLDHIMEHWQLV